MSMNGLPEPRLVVAYLKSWLEAVFPRRVRRWIYGVSVALAAYAVYLGSIEPEASPLILALIMAVLKSGPENPRE